MESTGVADGTPITSIKEQVFDVLKERHTIHPDDKRAIGHFDLFAEFNKVERLFGALNVVAYVVGILVLLSGIIGISNIMLIVVKERTKEIGIRKILGAGAISIVTMLSKDFLKLVLIAILFAIPLAYLFMEKWLQGFAYQVEFQWWIFILTGVLAVSIAFITVGLQSLKAALTNR